MLRSFSLVCVALLLVTVARAITVATYNVQNYLVTDRMVENVFRKAYPKPEDEKLALRTAIKAIAPDILAVQEMGTQPFLEELQRDLKADGVDLPYIVLLQADDPERHVAFLSKFPFKDIQRHAKLPITVLGKNEFVKRGALEVTVATNEGDLTLFTFHLKSRRTEDPKDPEGNAQRAAEAEAIRDLVLQRYPDPTKAKFLLCGDWNDVRVSKAVRTLGKRGDTDVGEILRAYDSRGETWTHAYRREDSYSRIDYILVSPALKPFVANKGTAKIYDGPGQRDASDHRAVYVKLNLAAAK